MRHLALRVRGQAIEVALVHGSRRPVTWVVPNRPSSVRRVVKLASVRSELRACCEDGPQAYALFWQLAALGVACDVVVPPGGPLANLARAHRDGALTFIWNPAAARSALAALGRASDGEDFEQQFEQDGVGDPPRPPAAPESGW